MKTFKQHLTENQDIHSVLQSIANNANKPPVFLTPSVMKRLKFSIEGVTAYHVTSYGNLRNLVKAQNKKSAQISVLTSFAEDGTITSGVETSGGAVVKVTGDIAAYFNKDAWTARTKGGRRTVLVSDPNQRGNAGTFTGAILSSLRLDTPPEQESLMRGLLSNLHNELVEARRKAFDKAFKNPKLVDTLFLNNSRVYKAFRENGESKGIRDHVDISLYNWVKKFDEPEVQKAQYTFVKAYMDEMEKVLADNSNYKILFNHEPLTNFMSANSLYDEGVLSNFTIEKVFILDIPGGFKFNAADSEDEKLNQAKSRVKEETGLKLSDDNILILREFNGETYNIVKAIEKDMNRNMKSFSEILDKHMKS